MIGSIIGGVASLGSAIYGTIASAKKNNEARSIIREQQAANKEWYTKKLAEDYTQRTDAQAVINKQRDLLNQQYGNAKATSIVTGGTDEALAMQKAAANKSVSDTMTNIASQASEYKESLERGMLQSDNAAAQQQAASLQQEGDAIAKAASAAANAGTSLIGNDAEATALKKAAKTGGKATKVDA